MVFKIFFNHGVGPKYNFSSHYPFWSVQRSSIIRNYPNSEKIRNVQFFSMKLQCPGSQLAFSHHLRVSFHRLSLIIIINIKGFLLGQLSLESDARRALLNLFLTLFKCYEILTWTSFVHYFGHYIINPHQLGSHVRSALYKVSQTSL